MKLSQQLLVYIEQHYSRIMFGLAVVFFMIMITGIREFLNYSTIIEATQNTVNEQAFREEKIAFENNFLLPYLQSDTARYFFAHENGSLFEGEQIIQFRGEDETLIIQKIEEQAEDINETITPSEAWNVYIKSLLSDIE